MKLKPEDFDWEKYEYQFEPLGDEGKEYFNVLGGVWSPVSPHHRYTTSPCITRLPKPEPLYQLLTPGTLIREGDEINLNGGDRWKKAVGPCGFSAARNEIWRRKLPEGTKLP